MADTPLAPRRQTPTLTAYLARNFALYLLLTVLALAAFAYLMDAVDLIAKASGRGLATPTLLAYSLTKLPSLMLQMLPFAVLIATLVTLNQLNRRHELVALRAVGLPARRIMLGPLIVVVLVGALALTLVNPLSATLLKSYERWHAATFPGSARGLVTAGGSIWLKQPEDNSTLFIHARNIGSQGRHLTDATLFTMSPQGQLTQRLITPELTLTPGAWQLSTTTAITAQGVTHHPSQSLPTTLTPAMLQNSFTPPQTLSIWQLPTYIGVLKQTGFSSAQHEMTLQTLLALPAFLIAMFVLGVPFALTFTRNRNLFAVVGAGLGLGFGFYLFANFMATFGLAGRLNVTLAAWAPVAIALLVGTALLLHLREE
ncbi:MAG: LPS export ABC transporter permease LptG [Pseudomonadaceae bacterium]|nr:LPS export ABC transporter permease LptG [Pseudomonadaceae bacterium]